MTSDTWPQATVAVASHSKHLVSHVGRKLKCVGLTALGVEPVSDALLGRFGESQSGVVVLDALRKDSDALTLAKELAEKRPRMKVVMLGSSADLECAAKAILAKASHFLLENTPSDEFGNAVADLLAGKPASDESMFGRVLSAFPSPTGKDDAFRTPAGRRLNAEEAIKQCDQFGLSVDDIADHLGVPIADVERVTKKARRSPRPSPLARTLSRLRPEMGGGQSGLPSLRNMMVVCALLATVWAAVFVVRQRGSLDRFVSLKGTAAYDNGTPLGTDVALMFGLQPSDEKESPSYSGVARIMGGGGEFATVVRLPSTALPPFTFRVAVLNKSLMPLDDDTISDSCTDLATTPLRITASDSGVRIRCPKPEGK